MRILVREFFGFHFAGDTADRARFARFVAFAGEPQLAFRARGDAGRYRIQLPG